MKRFLSWFRSPCRRPPAAANPRRPARPQLEWCDHTTRVWARPRRRLS